MKKLFLITVLLGLPQFSHAEINCRVSSTGRVVTNIADISSIPRGPEGCPIMIPLYQEAANRGTFYAYLNYSTSSVPSKTGATQKWASCGYNFIPNKNIEDQSTFPGKYECEIR